MGTSSNIIISNGENTRSFYVSFGSHKDDLGKKLKKLLNQTNEQNWQSEFIEILKENDKFQLMNKNIPTDITYLITEDKNLLIRYKTDFQSF